MVFKSVFLHPQSPRHKQHGVKYHISTLARCALSRKQQNGWNAQRHSMPYFTGRVIHLPVQSHAVRHELVL